MLDTMKYLLPILLLLLGCDQKKAQNTSEETKETTDCNTEVLVKDMQGMDGCTFIFESFDGQKFLPNSIPDLSFKFANNQLLRIGYKEVKDGASICMVESKVIDVHCLELKAQTGGVKPMSNQCQKINKLSESVWLSKIVEENSAFKVDRYDYLSSRYVYLVDNGRHKYLYDCAGSLLCSVEGKAMNECYQKVSKLKGMLNIWHKDARN